MKELKTFINLILKETISKEDKIVFIDWFQEIMARNEFGLEFQGLYADYIKYIPEEYHKFKLNRFIVGFRLENYKTVYNHNSLFEDLDEIWFYLKRKKDNEYEREFILMFDDYPDLTTLMYDIEQIIQNPFSYYPSRAK